MGFWGGRFMRSRSFLLLMLLVAFILGLRKVAQPCRNFLFFYFLFMPGTPVGPRGVTGLA